MTMDKKYDFKWKTFPDYLVHVFRELGEEGNFTDVTLVSDDQIQTPAHKVVLSACSPVLKTLLVNNPHSHPLLYLRGIKQTELQAILNFMYFGETQISENRINDFVSIAKDLQLKEISDGQEGEKEYNVPKTTEESPAMDDKDLSTNNEDKEELKINTKVSSKRNVAKPRQRSAASTDGRFTCDECEATFAQSWLVSRHKKSLHTGWVVKIHLLVVCKI